MQIEDIELTREDYFDFGVTDADFDRLNFLVEKEQSNYGNIPESEKEEIEEIDGRILMATPKALKNKMVKFGINLSTLD